MKLVKYFILVFIMVYMGLYCGDNNNSGDGGSTDTNTNTDIGINYPLCDPDEKDCPMICEEESFGKGKKCAEKDNLPDNSHWECVDRKDENGNWTRECKKRGTYTEGEYNEGWNCEQQGEFVVCEKEISNENNDYLEEQGEGYYDCWTEGEFVICEYRSGEEWECYEQDGRDICILREPDYPTDEDDWICYQFGGANGEWWTVCETDNMSGSENYGWECIELPNGKTRCQKSGRDYPEEGYEGELNCYYGEFGELICESPGGEHEICEPGQRRWCDGPSYCRWGYQECLPDGSWENGCHEFTNGEDRPNNPCGCRHVLFTPICCERIDCVIPEDHTPPDCRGDGQLCSWCIEDNDCGGPNNKCIYELETSRVSYCGRDCSQNRSCPENYVCAPMTNDRSVMQCTPVGGGERCDELWTPPQR